MKFQRTLAQNIHGKRRSFYYKTYWTLRKFWGRSSRGSVGGDLTFKRCPSVRAACSRYTCVQGACTLSLDVQSVPLAYEWTTRDTRISLVVRADREGTAFVFDIFSLIHSRDRERSDSRIVTRLSHRSTCFPKFLPAPAGCARTRVRDAGASAQEPADVNRSWDAIAKINVQKIKVQKTSLGFIQVTSSLY